ncbi:hypothetical protein [Nonomuraea sp. NPDC049784]|uniref:hypothetical protein n=1 Tax=Nonomuraea sp. NPDC049784 TaxID=3154361 RepID=UPI0033CB9308
MLYAVPAGRLSSIAPSRTGAFAATRVSPSSPMPYTSACRTCLQSAGSFQARASYPLRL